MNAGTRLCAFLCLCLIVGGCALIREDGTLTAQRDPASIRLADDLHLAREGWPESRWWARYQDPQLDQLIDMAFAQSTSIAIARSHIDQARAQAASVKSLSGVQVDLIGLVNRQHVSANGFLGPFAENEPSLGLTGPWYTEGIVGLGGAYQLDLWGRQRAQVDAALGVRNARQAEAAWVELEVSSGVTLLYFQIQTAQQLLADLQQMSTIAAEVVAAHQALIERGLESQPQRQQALSNQALIDRQIVALRSQSQQLREAMRALLGAGAEDSLPLAPRALPEHPYGVPQSLGYELLARRPDLQAMRWLVQSSYSNIDAAKAAFYPSFDIKAFFGADALHMGDLWDHGSRQINLIPGMTLPIFDGGRLNAELANARSLSNSLVQQYNQAVLDAVRDVAVAGSKLQGLDAQEVLQQSRIGNMRFNRDSAEAHYQRGLLGRVVALEANLPLLAEHSGLVLLQGQRLESEVALIKALGGGYHSTDSIAAVKE
ncbi:MdtP family multidrug efflux transporter outer membrane subunit [Pseudomonas sp. ADAK2]|uniref:MdtP family multidrug efflux transporter outer membrane subunit n=1 Tax=unclassified Pseudomonas TaxID=196821 RepID=UPI0014636472|nr:MULTISPECIES: MdtP family multidrug efflux transporter outer membrane subunit [unclassified Pseudomonas]QJI39434.1 MdtP family multidrug efflux transporter outer membrane subunit [Pseudomonas sp. ADAK7]QJI45740.1 MdtP family multidrug efflux transporter outer membrane subunit [Pseudomonas sp. ADAK2]